MDLNFIDPAKVLWDDWILFFAQVATLAALVVYVWKTWEMANATRVAAEASAAAANEAKEARLEALAPRLMIYFSPEAMHLAELVLENIGGGTASDVKITFQPPLQASNTGIDPNKYFETVKPIIPPQYRVVHGIDSWPSYLSAKLPRLYEVRIRYKGKENRREYDELHILDIDSLTHRIAFGNKGINDVVRELEKLGRIWEDKLKSIDAHLDELQNLNLLEVEQRPLCELLAEIVAVWETAKIVDADKKTRYRWEPTFMTLRRMAYNARLAVARESAAEDVRDVLIDLIRLLHIPSFLWQDSYDEELNAAIQKLLQIGPTSKLNK